MLASSERSTPSVVVDQLETLMRMVVRP